jgi:hypothetical protein
MVLLSICYGCLHTRSQPDPSGCIPLAFHPVAHVRHGFDIRLFAGEVVVTDSAFCPSGCLNTDPCYLGHHTEGGGQLSHRDLGLHTKMCICGFHRRNVPHNEP